VLKVSIATVTATVAAVASTGSAAPMPSIAIRSVSPLTVVGTGYRPNERVRLSVSIGTRRVSRDVALGRSGKFQVGFASIRLGRCAPAALIVAHGAGPGRVATVKRLPAPGCPLVE